MATLDLRPEWLAIVRGILEHHLPDAEVLAFGSRVNGTSHDGSDLDLVARNCADPTKPLPALLDAKEAFSESNLPILVDILDWARIPEHFRQQIISSGPITIVPFHHHP